MRQPLWAAIGSLVLIANLCSDASAQVTRPGVPSRSSGYSPFLNLVRGGQPTGFNYYGLVRPEVQFRQSIQNVQQQVNTLGTQVGETGPQSATSLPSTGHPTQFVNYGRYFFNQTGAGGSGQSRTPARTSAPRAAEDKAPP